LLKNVKAVDPNTGKEIDLNSGRYKYWSETYDEKGNLIDVYVRDVETNTIYRIVTSPNTEISGKSYSPFYNSSSRSSSSQSSFSNQYTFSSKELQGNKEFWNIYNTYAVKAVDERIKNDPEFRRILAESGDYAFARSQAILLTAIYKYKTGEDAIILATKRKDG